MYLVILETIHFPNKIFYEGVSWEEYTKNEDGTFSLLVDNVNYIINSEVAIETDRFTRSENIHRDAYRYQRDSDNTKDYVKALSQVGIDITQNYSPQFRDGINPMKDGKENQENVHQ